MILRAKSRRIDRGDKEERQKVEETINVSKTERDRQLWRNRFREDKPCTSGLCSAGSIREHLLNNGTETSVCAKSRTFNVN
jgi:hypothetical protein